jgi:hypothetical protein
MLLEVLFEIKKNILPIPHELSAHIFRFSLKRTII